MTSSALIAESSLSAETSEHGALPLSPIEQPRGWFVRALYYACKKRYGLVPTAFRVSYGRSPFLAVLSLVIGIGLLRFVRIEQELRALIQVALAMRTGCTFCADLQMAEALMAKVGRERFRDLLSFEDSARFTPREKAALAYTKALAESLHISDAVWAGLAAHFSERERLDIVWVCAVERYYNSMALPLRIGSDRLVERSAV
jgi:AhpD family alkylhydroperoxidase